MLQLLRVRHEFDITLGAVDPAPLTMHPVYMQVPVVKRFEDLAAVRAGEVAGLVTLLVHDKTTLIYETQSTSLTNIITKMYIHMFI